MDEAKTLVHMSIASIFAALFLAAAVGLTGVGYMLWSYFDRQESANNRMSDYSNYAAFDNATIRGQEVLGLIESDLDLFVVFCDGTSNSSKSIDEMTVSAPKYVYFDDVAGISDFDFSTITVNNSNVTCRNALTTLKNNGGNPNSISSNLNNLTHDNLVAFLTDTNSGMGAIALDNTGNVINTNSYSAFKSILVYANDGTTDVSGIILVRADSNVEF